MNDRTRMGAAVLGGYVLGRTKKGGAAVRLAMWLNGTSTGTLTRDGLMRLKNSPEVSKLLSQAGQPLMEAARGAAVAAVEARLSGFAEGLNRRTTKLLPPVADDEMVEPSDRDDDEVEWREAESDGRADQDEYDDVDDASVGERSRTAPTREQSSREQSSREQSSREQSIRARERARS